MDADWLTSALNFCGRVQTIVWVIWGGVAVLTVALGILMWTRWGKTRVTHKCIALSVFAHVLLFTYTGTAKMIGAPGPLGREGAPGIEGEHPTLLVADVQAGGEPDEKAAAGAPKPWHVTPLRAAMPPAPEPGREAAHFSTPPQRDERPLKRPISPGDEAEPLSPRTAATAPRSPIIPPEHEAPAASQEVIRPPPPAKQLGSSHLPRVGSEMPRQTVPQDVLSPNRQRPESRSLTAAPPGAGRDEPQPLSAVDRALSSKTQVSTAETAAPAASHAPEESSPDRVEPHAAAAPRPTSDGPPRLLADAARPTAEPTREPTSTSTTEPSGPRRHTLPPAYTHRLQAGRPNIVRKRGGSPDTEAAVKSALAWLAANQEPDGRWSAAKHGALVQRDVAWNSRNRQNEAIDVPNASMHPDTGVTGLALLAFLGAGHTHEGEQYQDNVRRGLDYLIRVQAGNGNLAGGATVYAAMYCHGMATLALAEAYGMIGDPKLLGPLRGAVAYTVAAQNDRGGWRYRPRDDFGDTSQFGWQVMALKAAEMAGLDIPLASRDGMLRFLGDVSSGQHGGLACYQCRIYPDGTRIMDGPTPTMTAEALFCRFLLGTTPANPLCKEAANYLLHHLPADDQVDLYYWYYGTLALYHLQGPAWDKWNRVVQQRILQLQERDGSWSTLDRWGSHGGRVFTTALATLTLEVYYRYVPGGPAGERKDE